MSRRESKTTPKIMGRVLYSDAGSITVDSAGWFAWLWRGETFYYQSNIGTFTARGERRGPGLYWYAFSKRNKKLYKAYIGKPEELTLERLDAVAWELDAKSLA